MPLALLLATPARALELVDDQGVSVTLAQPAKRIIALYGAYNEILLALNADDAIVARTVADATIPALAHLPAIGTHMRPNQELIVAQQPDLVLQLAGRKEAQTQTEALRQLGIPVLCYSMQSFEDLFRVTLALGQATGKAQAAERVVAGWKQRLESVRQQAAARPRVRVFYEVRYPNLLAAGRASIVNDIIQVAGGDNVVTEDKKLVRYSEESLLAANPLAYIVQQGPMNPAPQPVGERPHFTALDAVRNGRVLVVEEAVFARPGPRAIEAAEQLVAWFAGMGRK